METIIYTREDIGIKMTFEDLNATEFLEKTLKLMQSVWYNNTVIREALDKATID